jgi:hypothetical protein
MKISELEEQERQLVRGNMNGRNDTALYNLRKKLDALRQNEAKENSRLEEIARGNIERHLGDVAGESEDAIYDEAYTLAFDALADAGVVHAKAREIAQRVAQCFAQP